MALQIYNVGSDELVDATQDDIDELQRGCKRLYNKNLIVKAIANLNIVTDADILIKIANILKV